MTPRDAFNWREKRALLHFSEHGTSTPPHGVAGTTIFSLQQRRLIVRVENAKDFDDPRYRLTQSGLDAVEALSS
jgi:hypothetical protein